MPSAACTGLTGDNVKQHSQIYGQKSSSQLSRYHASINSAAEEICLKNPNLIHDRKTLIQESRNYVNDSGYCYKKRKSQSKVFRSEYETSPKRIKIDKDLKLVRMSGLQEKIKDVSDQIGYKEKRRDAADKVRNYKECDQLTEQICSLRSEEEQFESELKELQKSEKVYEVLSAKKA